MAQRGPRRAPPILLTMPHYGGTLAAVRCLGEQGISVTIAGDRLLAPARWSRYATRFVHCPVVTSSEQFLEWLLAFGRREPGQVLYPTSDDLAWLFAANLDELGKVFRMYQPAVDTLVTVLDKQRLWNACKAAGLETVPTWFPEDEADVERLADLLPFPLLIKARTQVLRASQTKGVVVRSRSDLLPGYRRFVAENRYLPGGERHFESARKPMLQQFCQEASIAVYSMTGFIDRSGELFAARGAVKLLQRTQPVGLGVCFEAAPLEADLAAGIARLCRAVGHFGVFEVEVLCEEDRRMIIDFNPRFYGQMGFDLRRGLPLALFAWLGACGEDVELRERIRSANLGPDGPATIYCHRVVFEMMLLVRRLAGQMSPAEHHRWRQWLAQHREGAVDASADRHDPLPGVVHTTAELLAGLRALPRVLRQR
jgi:D-aspartate ligase